MFTLDETKFFPQLTARVLFTSLLALGFGACSGPEKEELPSLGTVHLIDAFGGAKITGTAPSANIERAEWRWDAPDQVTGGLNGWTAGPGIGALEAKGGLLQGRTTDTASVLAFRWGGPADPNDELHEVVVRMRVSAGTKFWIRFVPGDEIQLDRIAAQSSELVWGVGGLSSPLVPGQEMRTYTLKYPATISAEEMSWIVLRPADVANAEFAIESMRVITRREHLASIPSGVSWQGLGEIYHETLASRSSEVIQFDVRLPERPRLHLSLGTLESSPLTFRIGLAHQGREQVVLERTISESRKWQEAQANLDAFSGKEVTLSFSTSGGQPAGLALWGSPSIYPARTDADPKPRGIIMIVADTLGAQYLQVHGYDRDTAPAFGRLAKEGIWFSDAQAEATWTKPSVTSMLTSLYPNTHGVTEFDSRLPATATTVAEAFRSAGWATLSMSSVYFTGRMSSLHQGFEELHEAASLQVQPSSKTAEGYMERLLPWIETHRDIPFFVLLHLYDPHFPYRPRAPYDTKWADPSRFEEHQRISIEMRKYIDDPLMQAIGMPTREQLQQTGSDPDQFMETWQGWYDGSVLSMDEQVARLIGHLRTLGLEKHVVLSMGSDHGEEFLQHGRTYHGQGLYEELTHVPMVLWGPGVLPQGVSVGRPVSNIDLMPTLLEIAEIPAPAGIQGTSLVPLINRAADSQLALPRERPVFAVKPVIFNIGPTPRSTEAFSIATSEWKLIHNTIPAPGISEYELFERIKDPGNRHNVAKEHPEIVASLAETLQNWRRSAESQRLSDTAFADELSAEELNRLKSLGYIQ